MITVHKCTKCGGGFFEHPRRGLCHMCYERKRLAGNVPGLVDAAPALDKIKALMNDGRRQAGMARAAHLNQSAVAFIIKGRQRINADTCFAIAAISTCRRAEFVVHVDPKIVKARARKAAASLTVEVKAERSRKIWVTRRANQAKAQSKPAIRIVLTPVEQRARQEVIMASRRRAAERQRDIAHPPAATLIGFPTGSWVDEALCSQADPDLWFPDKGGSTRDAKKVCLGCPVRQRFLGWVLTHEER